MFKKFTKNISNLSNLVEDGWLFDLGQGNHQFQPSAFFDDKLNKKQVAGESSSGRPRQPPTSFGGVVLMRIASCFFRVFY